MKNWPRTRKLALAAALLLLSSLIIFSMSNWPSPTLEIAIRRKEKQQLIGPSEIIGQVDYGYHNDSHLFLGKTEHGWITYEYIDDLGWDSAELRYFPKEENVTMFCPDILLRSDAEEWLPIFVFSDNRKAASAEMTIAISGMDSSDTYHLRGKITDGGYFLFSFPGSELRPEFFWLLQQSITNSCQEYVLTGTVEIQIEFYDRTGLLIDTYSKTVTK